MILTVAAIVLVSFVCLVAYPALFVALAALMLECQRAELPMARLIPKRKTGRRFQRPVYSRAS